MRPELRRLVASVLDLPKVEQAFVAEIVLRELSDQVYVRPSNANLEWIFSIWDKFEERLKERGVDFEMAVDALVDETYSVTPEQIKEIRRRSAEMETGAVTGVPVEEVLRMLREQRKPAT
jgi:hypothetical protein